MSSLPALSLASSLPGSADVVIVGLADAAGSPTVVGADAVAGAKELGSLEDLAARLGGTPKPGSAVTLPTADGVLVLVGLGEADVTPTRVRRATAAGVKKALETAGERAINVAISLDLAEPEIVAAAVEGAMLGSYTYTKAGTPAPAASITQLTLVAPEAAAQAAHRAEISARAVVIARDWVNTPANVLYPATFAEAARELMKGRKVDVTILDEKALAKGSFGGILAVGGGSAQAPRLVQLTWAPKGAQTTLALVGKGMTFDAGGLDLKTAEGMYTMKCDMGGAAAVLAAFWAIVELELPIKVVAYAPMAENMPSGTAYRPSDVLTMHSGKTVENANTDAEGRLILADALSLASQGNPDFIVDVATLTGACVVALGDRQIGLMANTDDAADRLLDAAEAAGEVMWHLPIPEEALENLKSDVADLKSSGPRYGGALNAAAFLREFVPAETPWAHLDIAGPAWADKPYHEVSKGGTGAGVRTLIALAAGLAR